MTADARRQAGSGDAQRAETAAMAIPDAVAPPTELSDLSVRDEIQLAPGKQTALHHARLARNQERDLDSARAEITRLRVIEIECARITQTRRLHRYVLSITGLSLVVGGGLVSTFQWNCNPVCFAIGWVLITMGGIIQIPLNLLD